MKREINFETVRTAAAVSIGHRNKTALVLVNIDAQFMEAVDLRETAKRLKKEAKRLDKIIGEL